MVFAGIGGDLHQVCALVGVVCGNRPDVGVVVAVGIRCAVAGEGELPAVGRPNRSRIIVVAASYLREALAGHIEEVAVGAATVKIANFVDFELQAVDHPRLLGLVFFFLRGFVVALFVLVLIFVPVPGGFEFFGRGVAQDQAQAFAVGRPFEAVDIL